MSSWTLSSEWSFWQVEQLCRGEYRSPRKVRAVLKCLWWRSRGTKPSEAETAPQAKKRSGRKGKKDRTEAKSFGLLKPNMQMLYVMYGCVLKEKALSGVWDREFQHSTCRRPFRDVIQLFEKASCWVTLRPWMPWRRLCFQRLVGARIEVRRDGAKSQVLLRDVLSHVWGLKSARTTKASSLG